MLFFNSKKIEKLEINWNVKNGKFAKVDALSSKNINPS